MLKKILISTLCALSLSSVCAYAFDDVSSEEEYYSQITSLSERGVVNGYGDNTFKPQNPVTRGEFAKMLCLALDVAERTGTAFSDVPSDSWAYEYIDALCSSGIIDGFEDGTFRPNDNILVKDAVKMVVCACGLGEKAESLGGYPHGYFTIAAVNGYTEGISSDNDSEITRGQTAVLLYNAVNARADGV